MKKTFFIIAISLLGMTQALAQEYEYVPFVREGVKWVYSYSNPFWSYILDMPEGDQYYSFEMQGDVLIGDKYYKPVILTHYLDKEGQNKEVEDYIPVYLREENKVVYAIHPDGIWHAQCPVGFGWFVGDPHEEPPFETSDEEFVLYDFNDPVQLYDETFGEQSTFIEYIATNMMIIGHHQVKVHHYNTWYSNDDNIIEGIGYDGFAGMPLFYFEVFNTGIQVRYGLSHVIENGEVIYKGKWYNPDIRVGVDEVVADKTLLPLDTHYYDLMGHAVGTEVPTAPGIYIHQGKKIVVR